MYQNLSKKNFKLSFKKALYLIRKKSNKLRKSSMKKKLKKGNISIIKELFCLKYLEFYYNFKFI
jgi:hypothetical protein